MNTMKKLKDFADVKTNMPDADFWIVRKGTVDSVGSVVKTFTAENIGVKVTQTDLLDHRFLAYKMEHLHTTGYYKKICKGTLRLQNITVSDVKNALME